jgi:hypothetical protein
MSFLRSWLRCSDSFFFFVSLERRAANLDSEGFGSARQQAASSVAARPTLAAPLVRQAAVTVIFH